MTRSNGVLAGLLGGALASTPAAALAAPPAHLSYTAPAGCPSEADFLAVIARDGGDFVRAADDARAMSLVVAVTVTDLVVGSVTIQPVDGPSSVRSIVGGRCDVVVRSLAVVTAMALAALPESGEKPPPPPTPPAHSDDVPPSPDPDLPPAPGMFTNLPLEPDLDDLPPEEEPKDDEWQPPPSQESRWRSGLAFDATFAGGPTTTLDPGLAIGFSAAYESGQIWAPELRLGAAVSWNATDVFDATRRTLLLRGDACPLGLDAAQPWSDDAVVLLACGRLDLGELGLIGRDNTAIHHVWAATAALLRVRWTSPRWFIEGEGGIVWPIGSYAAVTSGSDSVPSKAPTLGLGFGVLFH